MPRKETSWQISTRQHYIPQKIFQEEGYALLDRATPTLRLGRAPVCLAEAAVPQLQHRGETLPLTLPAHEGCHCHRSPPGTGDTLGPGIANRSAASQASGPYAPRLLETFKIQAETHVSGFVLSATSLEYSSHSLHFNTAKTLLYCLSSRQSSCLPGTRAGTKRGPVTWGTSSH